MTTAREYSQTGLAATAKTLQILRSNICNDFFLTMATHTRRLFGRRLYLFVFRLRWAPRPDGVPHFWLHENQLLANLFSDFSLAVLAGASTVEHKPFDVNAQPSCQGLQAVA